MPKGSETVRPQKPQGLVMDFVKSKGLLAKGASSALTINQGRSQPPQTILPQAQVIRTTSKQTPVASYSSIPEARVVRMPGQHQHPLPPKTPIAHSQSSQHDFGFWKSVVDFAHHVGSILGLSGRGPHKPIHKAPPPPPSVIRTASSSGISTSSLNKHQSKLPSVVRINNPITGEETLTTFDKIRRHLSGEPVFVPEAIPISS